MDWTAYRNSPILFRTVPSPTRYGRLFPKIGGLQPHQKPIAIISGTGKVTDFKFGQYIYGVHPYKSLKILKKRERGRIQGLPSFLKVPLRNG